MKKDVEIAQEAHCEPIQNIAKALNIREDQYTLYGNDKAKLELSLRNNESKGKLILVTAINPTPAGEGKTTMNIGLSMALNRLGYPAISALREPSMGPVFGMKGGATGGGYAQVLPMEDINLHFTGDIHAITSCHNLLTSILDNHLYHGNALNIDPNAIVWGRVLDMNDRWLRRLEGKSKVKHESHFDITAASEIMAILCLADSLEDLRKRLGNILVAYTYEGNPVYARDLDIVGAMMLILKDAIKPNLVQTIEHTPAILHGGPFANIAHGCNSVMATKIAMSLSDYTITEAGFGADLGAEKFLDIKCQQAHLAPDAIVLVATIRALKYNGGVAVEALNQENCDALKLGSANLVQHIENLQKYSSHVIVALNRFGSDTDEEIQVIESIVSELGVPFSVCDVFTQGGAGALDCAQKLVDITQSPARFTPLYHQVSILEGIQTVAREIYRAEDVTFDEEALNKINKIQAMYPKGLPVCIAKTQYSFSDDPQKLNAPRDFKMHVRDVRLANGAGFVVVLCGKVMTMPGLPKKPNAMNMDYDGVVRGLD